MREKSKNAVTYQKAICMEKRNQAEFPGDPVANAHLRIYSEKANKELEPVPHEIVAGECLPDLYERGDMNVWSPTCTLINPSSINQTASLDRMTLVEESGYQDLCIDAAETIGAENSLEKMLAHQMAVCHAQSMNLVTKAGKTRDDVVALKILNTAAKFMDVYQKGFEAIHKVKRGNRQTIIIKHQQVNVSGSGQAVFANSAGGSMGRGDD
jgi:hypothetical protein